VANQFAFFLSVSFRGKNLPLLLNAKAAPPRVCKEKFYACYPVARASGSFRC